jgi:hypothetical protein
VPVGVLDPCRLAGGLVDGECRDRIFATREYLFAFEIGRPECTVGEIDKAAVGMDVDRACGLPQLRCGVERVLCEQRLARDTGRGVEFVDTELMVSSVADFLVG